VDVVDVVLIVVVVAAAIHGLRLGAFVQVLTFGGFFVGLLAGALLVHFFRPRGCTAWAGWGAVGLGALLLSVQASIHFGKVRSGKLR